MKHPFTTLLAMITLVALAIFATVGCGGTSGSSTSERTLNVFATDDADTGYTGVWITVHKVTLKNSTGGSVEVLNSTDGLTVNFRALNDGAAKFLLLANGQVPDGTYNKIEFETSKTLTLVATGSGTATTMSFPGSLDATVAGHSTLSATISPALNIPGTTNLTIDFDLKNWSFSGSEITPVLLVHSGVGFSDPSRHSEFEFKGTIGSISGTSPDQTFALNLSTGGTVNVKTNDTTSIVGDGSATLTGNARVEVYGVYNPSTQSITAQIVRVESQFGGEQKAIGTISNSNGVALTFDMAPIFTRGFSPQGSQISISTNAQTEYRGAHGTNITALQFYAALLLAGPNGIVEAEGTFNAGTNILVAKSVHVQTEADMAEDEARGASNLPIEANGTFDLAIEESEGFTPPNGALHVKLASNVQIKDDNGNQLTLSNFFSLLASNSRTVKVKGAFNNNLFTASRVELRD